MRDWVALGATPLVAVMVTGKVPPAPGVPDKEPPLDSVTPLGSDPAVTEKVGAGVPEAVTVNEPGEP
ncbi:MAG: hypothetical protein JNN20_12080 [Betaproteobacteria bacterium]|nr:hypothetical protein [Betaproteobacteria bacterium]